MKKSNILAIVLIAGALAGIMSMIGDFSSYETFATAEQKPGKEFQIIGKLDTITAKMEYHPMKNANEFIFYAKDEAGVSRKIIFNGTKPQDFERSEKLTMTGCMQDGHFKCNRILMKCPSKYKPDQEVIGKSS
jgi:cytochrome c-type biogenesis protein CcmE